MYVSKAFKMHFFAFGLEQILLKRSPNLRCNAMYGNAGTDVVTKMLVIEFHIGLEAVLCEFCILQNLIPFSIQII